MNALDHLLDNDSRTSEKIELDNKNVNIYF